MNTPRQGPSAKVPNVHSKVAHSALERSHAHLEGFRAGPKTARMLTQRFGYFVPPQAPPIVWDIRRLAPGTDLEALNLDCIRPQQGSGDRVAQLSNVPGPGVNSQLIEGRSGSTPLPENPGFGTQEVLDERRQVGRTLSQRWNRDAHHVQPVEEILTKSTPLDFLQEIAVRCDDDPSIGLDLPGVSHRPIASIFEHTQQLRLCVEGQLSNFIEKDRAPTCRGKQPPSIANGSREGSADRSKEFTFEQTPGDRRAIDGDEGFTGPGSGVVDRTGDQLFACSGFTGDEHRNVTTAASLDPGTDFTHLSAASDQRVLCGLTRSGFMFRARERSNHPAESDDLEDCFAELLEILGTLDQIF